MNCVIGPCARWRFFVRRRDIIEITIDDILNVVQLYGKEDLEKIKKAYYKAEELHSGQIRQSGEPYISHPLNVAYILAEMHADSDTICAGLLHDTLEDTQITKEEIKYEFNEDIANLVDGVTKLAKMNFVTKKDQNLANSRKIIVGITEDVRIIIIKLADRLHNMRTLDFKSPEKQKENALETMQIYVPLAYYIGSYRIKSELEDLSFKYLKPEIYKELEEKKNKIEEDSFYCLKEMADKISNILTNQNIPNDIKIRTKNIYGIYKRLCQGNKLLEIHDLLSLKIMVDEIYNCYQTLGIIHKEYMPINNKFKDYICNPKTNMYSSLHTTVFGPNDRLVQTQIRTFDMDRIASFGIMAYWQKENGNAQKIMQEELKQKYQFFNSLIEIDKIFGDNQEFINQIQTELFSDRIYVYTTNGQIIELPKGSTTIDLAYKLDTNIGNTMVGVSVNNVYVPVGYILQNKDRVKIITDELAYGPRMEWEDMAMTTHAKTKIKEFYQNDKTI